MAFLIFFSIKFPLHIILYIIIVTYFTEQFNKHKIKNRIGLRIITFVTQKLKLKTKRGGLHMADMSHFTKEMKDYFDNLPKFLQESIVQSGTKVESLGELRAFSKEICEKGFGKRA